MFVLAFYQPTCRRRFSLHISASGCSNCKSNLSGCILLQIIIMRSFSHELQIIHVLVLLLRVSLYYIIQFSSDRNIRLGHQYISIISPGTSTTPTSASSQFPVPSSQQQKSPVSQQTHQTPSFVYSSVRWLSAGSWFGLSSQIISETKI